MAIFRILTGILRHLRGFFVVQLSLTTRENQALFRANILPDYLPVMPCQARTR